MTNNQSNLLVLAIALIMFTATNCIILFSDYSVSGIALVFVCLFYYLLLTLAVRSWKNYLGQKDGAQ